MQLLGASTNTATNIFLQSLPSSSSRIMSSLLPSIALQNIHPIRAALPVLFAAASSTSGFSSFGDDTNESNSDDTNISDANPPSPREQQSPDTTNQAACTVWDPTQPTMTQSPSSNNQQQEKTSKMDQAKQLVTLPRPRAILYMTLAMALHFGGYEFVRSGMLALFTSQTVGFANAAGAFPLAMGLVSPCSVVLLMGYNRVLEQRGPRAALRNTTAFSLAVFAVVCATLTLLQSSTAAAGASFKVASSQALVAFGFIYQNAYAHLLYT